MKLKRRNRLASPVAWMERNGKAFLVTEIVQLAVDGKLVVLPPDVIGVSFVYGTREMAEHRNPGAEIREITHQNRRGS